MCYYSVICICKVCVVKQGREQLVSYDLLVKCVGESLTNACYSGTFSDHTGVLTGNKCIICLTVLRCVGVYIVYVFLCMHVLVCVFVYVCVSVCRCVCGRMLAHSCVCVCVCVCTSVFTSFAAPASVCVFACT